MDYLHVDKVNTGIKILVEDIKKRNNFAGDTKHWMAASLKHGAINVLPFNFIDDELPSRIIDDCFPNGYTISIVFNNKRHVILQPKNNQDIFENVIAIVHSKKEKTYVFDKFVICSSCQDDTFHSLSIDEVAEVLEQLQLNPFLNLIEVSRYY